MKKIIKKLWFPLMFLILILYHSFLMQMPPWQIQKLDCKLNNTNINSYKVPSNIKLEIYGWGQGKFTNNQYFGTKTFGIDKNGNQFDDFFEKIFGTYNYSFEIPYKNNEFDETHYFSIPKKKQILIDKNGNKIRAKIRMLLLLDYGTEENEYPEAFWFCEDL